MEIATRLACALTPAPELHSHVATATSATPGRISNVAVMSLDFHVDLRRLYRAKGIRGR